MAEDLRAQLEVLRSHGATLRALHVRITHEYASGRLSRKEEVAALTTIIQETNAVVDDLTALVSEWSKQSPPDSNRATTERGTM